MPTMSNCEVTISETVILLSYVSIVKPFLCEKKRHLATGEDSNKLYASGLSCKALIFV